MNLILPNLCRLSIVGVCGDDQQELQKVREQFFISKIEERLAYDVEARRELIIDSHVATIREMMDVDDELELSRTNPFEFKVYTMLKMCVFTHVFLMDPGFKLHTGISPNSAGPTEEQLKTIKRFVAAFVPWKITNIDSKDAWTKHEAPRQPNGWQSNSFNELFLSDEPELKGHFLRCAALLHIAYESEIARFDILKQARTASIRFKARNDNSTELTLDSFGQNVKKVIDSNNTLLKNAKTNLCGNLPESFTMYDALSKAREELERKALERALELVRKREERLEKAKRRQGAPAAQPDQ